MPRMARASVGGYFYHVLNRGNARARVFHDNNDMLEFVSLMQQSSLRLPMRIVAYCLLPNHFHLVLQPWNDADLGRWMHWLLTSHVRKYIKKYASTGHVWQGRFKAFPIQNDQHLTTVVRYVERNPLRAGLVDQAQDWPWSSLHPRSAEFVVDLEPSWRSPNWVSFVNQSITNAELEAIRHSINKGRPFGSESWIKETARTLGLESTLRPPGRPGNQPN